MKMGVKDRLSGTGIIIVDDTEPIVRNPATPGNVRRNLEYMADNSQIVVLHVQHIDKMSFRDNEQMNRRDRGDVFDRYDQVVLEKLFRRDRALDYFTEDTAVHLHHPCPEA
jgi:hypothetical protein